MKRKARYYAETKQMNNGNYAVLRQWTDGGAIATDDNGKKGFSLEEATALVSQHKLLNNLIKG